MSCASCCARGATPRRSARKAVVDWIVRGVLALLLIGIAVRLRLHGDLADDRPARQPLSARGGADGFAGYAAMFDRPTSGGDVIREGGVRAQPRRAAGEGAAAVAAQRAG